MSQLSQSTLDLLERWATAGVFPVPVMEPDEVAGLRQLIAENLVQGLIQRSAGGVVTGSLLSITRDGRSLLVLRAVREAGKADKSARADMRPFRRPAK